MFTHPSLYAHIMSGIFVMASIVYLVLNYSKITSKDPYQMVALMLLFSIALGVHGLSHLGLERVYGYDPYFMVTGKHMF
jgi:hypothetical protein